MIAIRNYKRIQACVDLHYSDTHFCNDCGHIR